MTGRWPKRRLEESTTDWKLERQRTRVESREERTMGSWGNGEASAESTVWGGGGDGWEARRRMNRPLGCGEPCRAQWSLHT
ncbi:hypothetical protein HAX54_036259, partial [Datura stramonium]|nr:hypothetical protein [Datura stramonium]